MTQTPLIAELRKQLHAAVTIPSVHRSRFFKTAPGEYAAHDQFLGVTVPALRRLVKSFATLPLDALPHLVTSPYNEERMLALLILVHHYQKGDLSHKEACYQFYWRYISYINNWNLVDVSAHLVIGAYLYDKDRTPLITLTQSENLWKRRIAIVATWYFIRQEDLTWTFKLAERLRNDPHDLMHKAIGWMLREAGKRDQQALASFLKQHAPHMPRTMLRYALERFFPDVRKDYMQRG